MDQDDAFQKENSNKSSSNWLDNFKLKKGKDFKKNRKFWLNKTSGRGAVYKFTKEKIKNKKTDYGLSKASLLDSDLHFDVDDDEDEDLFKNSTASLRYKLFYPLSSSKQSYNTMFDRGNRQSLYGNLLSGSKSKIVKTVKTRKHFGKNRSNNTNERSLRQNSDDSDLYLFMFLDYFRDLFEANQVKTTKSNLMIKNSKKVQTKSNFKYNSSVAKQKSTRIAQPTSNHKRQVRFDFKSNTSIRNPTNNRRCDLLEQGFDHGTIEIIDMIKRQGANVKSVIEERKKILHSFQSIRNELTDIIRCVSTKNILNPCDVKSN